MPRPRVAHARVTCAHNAYVRPRIRIKEAGFRAGASQTDSDETKKFSDAFTCLTCPFESLALRLRVHAGHTRAGHAPARISGCHLEKAPPIRTRAYMHAREMDFLELGKANCPKNSWARLRFAPIARAREGARLKLQPMIAIRAGAVARSTRMRLCGHAHMYTCTHMHVHTYAGGRSPGRAPHAPHVRMYAQAQAPSPRQARPAHPAKTPRKPPRPTSPRHCPPQPQPQAPRGFFGALRRAEKKPRNQPKTQARKKSP